MCPCIEKLFQKPGDEWRSPRDVKERASTTSATKTAEQAYFVLPCIEKLFQKPGDAWRSAVTPRKRASTTSATKTAGKYGDNWPASGRPASPCPHGERLLPFLTSHLPTRADIVYPISSSRRIPFTSRRTIVRSLRRLQLIKPRISFCFVWP
jgi:hypothetical protein